MSFDFLFFSILAFMFVFSILGIYISDNPVFSIISLVIAMILSSFILFYLGCEFLALILLVVYVGAVAVLFLFVVMLLGTRYVSISLNALPSWFMVMLFIGLLIIMVSFFFFSNTIFFIEHLDKFYVDYFFILNNLTNLGILGYYIMTSLLLIVAALVLLVAMLGAICLTL